MADLQGEAALQRRFTNIRGSQATTAYMRLLGTAAVAEQKKLVRRKTGNTGRTIRLASVTARSALTTAAGAAVFLEDGTQPHIIRPRFRKALRFAASGVATTLAGRVTAGAARSLGKAAYVFARVVHHPGTKPYPFMVPGARAAMRAFDFAGAVINRWNRP